jgi:hypothetical protein
MTTLDLSSERRAEGCCVCRIAPPPTCVLASALVCRLQAPRARCHMCRGFRPSVHVVVHFMRLGVQRWAARRWLRGVFCSTDVHVVTWRVDVTNVMWARARR